MVSGDAAFMPLQNAMIFVHSEHPEAADLIQRNFQCAHHGGSLFRQQKFSISA
jgi:hypothetical protein